MVVSMRIMPPMSKSFALMYLCLACTLFGAEEKGNATKNSSQTVIRSYPSEKTVYSQPVTFAANVFATRLPGILPTGTIEFTINRTTTVTAPLLNGTAKLTTSSIASSQGIFHYIVASYSGDSIYNPSQDVMELLVSPASTIISIQSSANPSFWNDPITYTATLNSLAPATEKPTGPLLVQIDDIHIASVEPEEKSGKYFFSPPESLSVGEHKITVVYQGNENFMESTFTLTQEIEPAATSTDIILPENSSIYGKGVVINFSVSSTNGNPTGSLQLKVDGKRFGKPLLLNTQREAKVTLRDLETGMHMIEALYLGDASFSSSLAAVTLQVNKAKSQLHLSSSDNPSFINQPMKFTATVDSENIIPSGFVQFKVDGKNYAKPVPLSATSLATIEIGYLSSGNHHIEANYLGSERFAPATDTLEQQVKKEAVSVSITSSKNPARSGENVTFTASVKGINIPDGFIQFQIDGTDAGTPVLLNNKFEATLILSKELKEGKQKITAKYSGNDEFEPSLSTPLIQVITGSNLMVP